MKYLGELQKQQEHGHNHTFLIQIYNRLGCFFHKKYIL